MNASPALAQHIAIGPEHVAVQAWEPTGGSAAAEAAPLVLLHESLGCVALWRDFPARLCAATGRRVIAYDRPGYGQSSPRTAPPPLGFIDRHAADVLAPLLDALGVARFVAVGHSTGASMALAAGAQLAPRCEAVVSLAGHAFVEDLTLQGVRQAKARFADPDAFARLQRHHGPRTRWVLDSWIDTWLDPRFARWTLDPLLPALTRPTLLLHGADDPYGSFAHARRVAAAAPGPVQPRLLAQCRHTPHFDQPEATLAHIARFLQDIGAAQRSEAK